MLIINSLWISWKEKSERHPHIGARRKREKTLWLYCPTFTSEFSSSFSAFHSSSVQFSSSFPFFLCEDREKIGETNESLEFVCMSEWIFFLFSTACVTMKGCCESVKKRERISEFFLPFLFVKSKVPSNSIHLFRVAYLWWILGGQSGLVVHLGFRVCFPASVFWVCLFISLLFHITKPSTFLSHFSFA